MMSLILRAYAKINLTLEVLFKRDDGYHEIASVLQTISMGDTLTFEASDRLEPQSDIPDLRPDDNLVLQAARLLSESTGCIKGARISLIKEIPVAAGLGSGATDAAATLNGLNQLWELNLSTQRLVELAANLGSDVAFFLYGGTALARGRGETVTPLPPAPELWMVLLRPDIEPGPGKTAQLYSQLHAQNFTSGQFTQRLVDHLHEGGGISTSLLFNVFEQVAFTYFPGLSDYRTRFVGAGADSVHLAGAGPTLYTLVPGEAQGKTIVNNLAADELDAYLVHTVGASPSDAAHNKQC
ncbi:MAG TPA: 4-(cytidine 5'-diphospho)-2-C-methyl-D-erythritol kinase [Dehalococcoidia bacterium]|nr:4-(cytidine 5'-diphospho)-2-C-methyl-D-erythritol kinase [Dehalococcoidia bacterium]